MKITTGQSGSTAPLFLDCTLRDGGYYNAWDFPADLVTDYLVAMQAAGVDIVELGFRFLKNEGFEGAHAFTTDDYLRGLSIPTDLTVGVRVNGADLCTDLGREAALERLSLTVGSRMIAHLPNE